MMLLSDKVKFSKK